MEFKSYAISEKIKKYNIHDFLKNTVNDSLTFSTNITNIKNAVVLNLHLSGKEIK